MFFLQLNRVELLLLLSQQCALEANRKKKTTTTICIVIIISSLVCSSIINFLFLLSELQRDWSAEVDSTFFQKLEDIQESFYEIVYVDVVLVGFGTGDAKSLLSEVSQIYTIWNRSISVHFE
jgi:hypothetical protein